jgi:hypothetical protein
LPSHKKIEKIEKIEKMDEKWNKKDINGEGISRFLGYHRLASLNYPIFLS